MDCKLIDKILFINALNTLIKDKVIMDTEDPNKVYPDIKLIFILGITELYNQFNDYSKQEFIESVKEYLSEDTGRYSFGEFIDLWGFDYLKQLLDVDIEEALKNISETEAKESKTDSFATVQEKAQKNANQGLFLLKYFPLASTSRLFFERNFRNRLIYSLFVDTELNKLINSNSDRNKAIKKFRQELKNEIYEAIKLTNPTEAKIFLSILSIESALAYAEKLLNPSLYLIQQIPLINTKKLSESRITLLKGWLALIALKNFDPLVKLVLDKAVKINNANLYEAVVGDKYIFNYGDRNSTTWRNDDEDVDETEELGSLPILFLESLKVFDESGNELQENLQFSDVKVAIGNLMKIFDSISQEKVGDIKDEFVNELSPLYGVEQITDIWTTFVENKTFAQILASTKEHPSLLMPVLFKLLTPINITRRGVTYSGNSKFISLFDVLPKTKKVFNSLYYNLFSNRDNSLFVMNSTENGFDANSPSLYNDLAALIINIENKPALEYNSTYDEGIKLVELALKNTRTRANALTRAIDGKFNKKSPLGEVIDSNTTKFNNFTLHDNLDGKDSDYLKGITIDSNGYQIVVKPDLSVSIFKDSQLQVGDSFNINDFIPLITEVLNLSPEIFEIYTGTLKGITLDVISLVSRILYNYLVGKHMLNVKESEYNEVAKLYYTNDVPKQMYHLLQPSLISSGDFTSTLELISKARDIYESYSEVNTVRDGAGKLISTLGLSALLPKVREIWENHTKLADSPASGLSIFDLYAGFELIRDFSGLGMDKLGKAFTQNELAKASFIYDMYGDMKEKDEKGRVIPGVLRVMGPVVADKSNLVKLKFSWDALTKYYRDDKLLRLRDMTIEDLKNAIYQEFGEYYEKVYKNITSLYDILNKYITEAFALLSKSEVLLTETFDYDNNFLKLNDFLIEYNTNPEKVVVPVSTWQLLHETIYLAQSRGENVELIDEVSYIKQKDGSITNNPSIIHQLKLFGKGKSTFRTSMNTNETYEDFWHRKEIQLVTDFLQAQINYQLYDGEQPKKGYAIEKAIASNNGFIKNGRVAVAKIHNRERSYLITSILDLKDWNPYRRFVEENLDKRYDVNNPLFNIEETLRAISEHSLLWTLLSKEKIAEISEKVDWKSLGIINWVNEARRLYEINRRKNSRKLLTSEEIEEGWKKKLISFKSAEELVEYAKTSKLRNDLRDYFSGDILLLEGTKYLESIVNEEENSNNYTIEINPEIIKHNLYDFYLGESFILATTGTYVAHPAKEKSSITVRESELFGQAVKRYVSYTATKHREALNFLNGIRQTLNIAVIEDDRDSSWNYSGDALGGAKPFDGASIYSGTMVYLDNNSLGGDAMGVDKKPFGHALGLKSGIGFILKTAGFALTNDRIRVGDKMNRILNRKMLDIPWALAMNWTLDYNGNQINYGEWYKFENGEWYKYSSPQVDDNGHTLIIRLKVDLLGNPENNGELIDKGIINTNYQLWNLFGGEYSGHFDEDGKLTYEQDNSSFERLVKAYNSVGIKKYKKAFDLWGVQLVLKEALIDIVATAGAVKYGGANINSKDAYFNEDYNLTYMTIDAYDFGELLDAEHSAEDGSVALMTLVVNALGARGYTRQLALECYLALEVIAETINKDGLQGLASGNILAVKDAASIIIYKTLKRASFNDGSLLNALAATIGDLNNKKWDNLQGVFPVSHPGIFGKIISSIASELEKSIRLKFEGGMLVLNPSNRRMTIIGRNPTGYYYDHMDELLQLEEENKSHPIHHKADIKVGYNYRDYVTGELIKILTPDDLYALDLTNRTLYETVIDDKGNPLGRDLAAYQGKFYDIDGNAYNIWELDSVRLLWKNSNKELRKLLLVQFLEDLNAISNGINSRVSVNGRIVRVDKSKTVSQGYEAIMPMIYKTEFGLRTGDNIHAILNNQAFFISRMLDNWKSTIQNSSFYDLELKSLDGNHIYLGLPREEVDFDLVKVNFDTELENDIMYRVTPDGKRLYEIPFHYDKGVAVPDVEIYRTVEGREILYSNNLTHFLDQFHYNTVIFSSGNLEVFNQVNASVNKVARRKVDNLVRLINGRINDEKNLSQDDKLVKSLLEAISEETRQDSLSEWLNTDPTITINDILENEELTLDLLKYLDKDRNVVNSKLRKLLADLNAKLPIEELIKRNPLFRGLIYSGRDIHTSFQLSLEMIVSRTPAQSQLSFMSMYIAAFGPETTNSAYVNRLQLVFQGSDYDVDKISVLGLKFKQGVLQTWSPYFDLSSQEAFEKSKVLPFPTGKVLATEGTLRAYDALENNVMVTTGPIGETILSLANGEFISIFIQENGEFVINGVVNSKLGQYILSRNALSKIPKGAKVNFQINMGNDEALGIKDGINTLEYDLVQDELEFFEAVFPGGRFLENADIRHLDMINMADNLALLIRTYNKLGYSNLDVVRKIVDYHNTFLKGLRRLDAAYNFISIRAKDISKDPINLIQAQAAIDDQTELIKNLLKPHYDENGHLDNRKFLLLTTAASKLDRGSIYSKFFMLTLTLAGKENVGIVASSMKNFEAISQYIYLTLDEGTREELEALAFNRTINGHLLRLIANSYTRNMDNIKSNIIREILENFDNTTDLFLVLSALLSLATDNAKDPVLSKFNAGPEMMSLFTSGVVLGLSVKEIGELTLTETGLLLSRLTKGDVFEGNKGFTRLTQAIQYLQRPPAFRFTKELYESISNIFRKIGLIGEDEVLTKTKLDNFLKAERVSEDYHEIIKRIFKFLSNPNIESKILEFDKENFVKSLIALLKNSSDYRRFSERSLEKLNELLAKEELTEEEVKLRDKLAARKVEKEKILSLIDLLYNYLNNGIIPNDAMLLSLIDFAGKVSKEDFKSDISSIRTALYSDKSFSTNIAKIIDWINYLEIISGDYVKGLDERDHKVLNQIARIDEFSQEMANLRSIMALNQGLPNTVEDLFNFISNFGNIIISRLNTIGETNRQRFYNVETELLLLEEFNRRLREQGIIKSESPYYIDLNTFIYNSEYNDLVKRIYDKIKFSINPLRIADGVNHYRAYLRLANLLVLKGKVISCVYQTALDINDRILPKMNARATAHKEAIRKNILSVIYRQINLKYLLKQKVYREIPNFEIIDGKLLLKPGVQQIRLGYRDSNEKFKQWMQFIEFPRLLKEKSDNQFLSYLGFRSYDFNEDRNTSINIAKIYQVNKLNPSSMVRFDQAKSGLLNLTSKDIENFFYYNLIAYNNLSGLLSLTDLFEDLIAGNNFEAIRNYNEFISLLEGEVIPFLSDDDLMKLIAPTISIYEVNNSLNIPYIYVRNREDGITYLFRKVKDTSSDDLQLFPDGFPGEWEPSNTKENFFSLLKSSNYVEEGEVLDNEQPSALIINDNKIIYNNQTYTEELLLKIAKKNGFEINSIFITKNKDGKVIKTLIPGILDTIFNDKNNC